MHGGIVVRYNDTWFCVYKYDVMLTLVETRIFHSICAYCQPHLITNEIKSNSTLLTNKLNKIIQDLFGRTMALRSDTKDRIFKPIIIYRFYTDHHIPDEQTINQINNNIKKALNSVVISTYADIPFRIMYIDELNLDLVAYYLDYNFNRRSNDMDEKNFLHFKNNHIILSYRVKNYDSRLKSYVYKYRYLKKVYNLFVYKSKCSGIAHMFHIIHVQIIHYERSVVNYNKNYSFINPCIVSNSKYIYSPMDANMDCVRLDLYNVSRNDNFTFFGKYDTKLCELLVHFIINKKKRCENDPFCYFETTALLFPKPITKTSSKPVMYIYIYELNNINSINDILTVIQHRIHLCSNDIQSNTSKRKRVSTSMACFRDIFYAEFIKLTLSKLNIKFENTKGMDKKQLDIEWLLDPRISLNNHQPHSTQVQQQSTIVLLNEGWHINMLKPHTINTKNIILTTLATIANVILIGLASAYFFLLIKNQ